MTEEEWLTCADPSPMLEFLRGKASERQSRHLMVHFAHELLAWRHDDATRAVITILDRYAEGVIASEELHNALLPFAASCPVLADDGYPWSVQDGAQPVHAHVVAADLWLIRRFIPPEMTVSTLSDLTGLRLSPKDADILDYFQWLVCNTLRDIIANPFRPVSADSKWLTSTVVALAEGIYAERAFDRMPILAHALEEASCDNADILHHCRGKGPHVRGCWVVDLLTGQK